MNTRPPKDVLGISGTLIADKYRIGEVIGEGGFSVVYKAEHTIWRQPVAIKCFKILANAPPDQRDQLLDGFIQEGKLMTALSSRSAAIVQARDVGTFTTADGLWIPYMVLEWLEGKPLDAILMEENRAGMAPRSLVEIVTLLEGTAVALEVVHRQNIAHRDIKPANIFIIGDPRAQGAFVKVLDFGIAKVMAEHAQMATALAQTGKTITAFTPNYGAPEQFSRTHGATGPWTDVFAMALILIEMMRGAPVLQGDDYLQLAVASRDPMTRPTPRNLGLDVSATVEAVFARALEVSPKDRYPRMGQFWADLHHAVFPEASIWSPGTSISFVSTTGSHTPSPGGRMAALIDAQTGAGVTSSAARLASTGSSSSARGLAIFGGVAMLALAGGGFAAYRIFGGGPPIEPSPAATQTAALPLPASGSVIASAAVRPTECPSGMVLVPGGRFFMGSDDAALAVAKPAHRVTLDTFCVDSNEVTAAEYKDCSDHGECKRADLDPSYPKSDGTSDADHTKNRAAYAEFCNFGKEGREKHPINCVSWALADNYCKVQKKRLPTEAEWEFAARGSDGRKFPWGDDPGDATRMNACGSECNAWETTKGLKPSARMYDADDGYPGTAPVGSFAAGKTKLGVNDMVGNVWEWTADWFEIYRNEEQVNPRGAATGERKVIRGGAFNGGAQTWVSPAFRAHQVATASSHGIGFRCAINL
jgi:formylglycine-generating enzyme required for sulfatase activity/serine/threonine protein kinase